MVDVYAREGMFSEAEELIGDRNDIELWSALLGGCRKFNNIEMGEKVFTKIVNIDKFNAAPYILLSNIYKAHGLTTKSNHIMDLMEKRGLKKIPGIVVCEENGIVFKFISGSDQYNRKYEVDQMRDVLYRKISEFGFNHDTKSVNNMKPMSDIEKVQVLREHAEKTAIAHAFVINPNRKEILLTNNLRMCHDCHNFAAFVSKVMGVDIIIRDASRCHHFKGGNAVAMSIGNIK